MRERRSRDCYHHLASERSLSSLCAQDRTIRIFLQACWLVYEFSIYISSKQAYNQMVSVCSRLYIHLFSNLCDPNTPKMMLKYLAKHKRAERKTRFHNLIYEKYPTEDGTYNIRYLWRDIFTILTLPYWLVMLSLELRDA